MLLYLTGIIGAILFGCIIGYTLTGYCESKNPTSLDFDQTDSQQLVSNVKIQSNGNTYWGSTMKEVKHGYGEERFSNGMVYHGMYRRGKKHGIGMMYFVDGSRWMGEWNNGHQWKGIRIDQNGSKYLQQWGWDKQTNKTKCVRVFCPVLKSCIECAIHQQNGAQVSAMRINAPHVLMGGVLPMSGIRFRMGAPQQPIQQTEGGGKANEDAKNKQDESVLVAA